MRPGARHGPGLPRPHSEGDPLTASALTLGTHATRLHEPVLRHRLYLHCTREFDINATTGGYEPERPTWSGKGWVQVKQLDGHMRPEHAPVVGNLVVPGPHLPRWHHGDAEAWKDHLLPTA